MSFPNFSPNPELIDSIEAKGNSSFVNEVAEIFSYDGEERISSIVLQAIDDSETSSSDIVRFVHEYYERVLDIENNFQSSERSEIVFELLKKYPNACGRLLKGKDSQKFKELDPGSKIELILAGFYQSCVKRHRDQAIFNGTKQYRIMQNVHGDVWLWGLAFDGQWDLFGKAVTDVDDASYGGVRMYQETTPLFTALCLLYKKSGRLLKDLEDFEVWLSWLSSLTPFATDVWLDDFSVHMAETFIFEKEVFWKDVTGSYERTGLNIYTGPGEGGLHPKIALLNRSSLAFLVPSETWSIQFGDGEVANHFEKVFEIPKEDIFGVLSLVYKLPGRSWATNKGILQAFVRRYSEEFHENSENPLLLPGK